MIIFKGKLNGKIAKYELKNFNPTSVYACQDAAWMDEQCMLVWVEEIFALYLLANPLPPGIQPVILLDGYQCHMMQLVVSKVAVLGVEVIHIPGGCTGLCQPLDVDINKLFKHHCHLLWKDWMMNIINTDSVIREAMCKEVAAWTAEVFWDMMGKKFLKNECDRRWNTTGSRVWLRRKVWMVRSPRNLAW
jgi:hypothetical protein